MVISFNHPNFIQNTTPVNYTNGYIFAKKSFKITGLEALKYLLKKNLYEF